MVVSNPCIKDVHEIGKHKFEVVIDFSYKTICHLPECMDEVLAQHLLLGFYRLLTELLFQYNGYAGGSRFLSERSVCEAVS